MVRLAAVGDILLDRGVAERMERFGEDYPFAEVRDELAAADVTLGNLECPVATRGHPVRKPAVFRAAPERLAALTAAGFDLVWLGNNHALDYGRAGLVDTMEHLTAQGLRFVGAGRTAAAARAPVVVERKGLRIAFLSFSAFLPEGVFVRPEEPGVAWLDPEVVEAQIRLARSQADVVVVSLHWGVEHSPRPLERQREQAHRFVDAGADLLLGHHPHVLQGLEVYRSALIAYSLGNFVFDSPSRQVSTTAILHCDLTAEGVIQAEMTPLAVRGWRPIRMEPDGVAKTLTQWQRQAERLGTTLEVTAGRARIEVGGKGKERKEGKEGRAEEPLSRNQEGPIRPGEER
jgi:poly-gamma-glutamate synthesis protein (capsule biosynthesis protein)